MSYSRIRWLVAAAWIVTIVTWIATRPGPLAPAHRPAGATADGASLFWFKGNTHAHARIELGGWSHGNASTAEVEAWYRDHGYHFLAITDHNRWHDGQSEVEGGGEFLLIPAMEITSDHRYPGVTQAGERKVHSTALGISEPVAWTFDEPRISSILDLHAQRAEASGGLAIVNHPNYRFQVTPADLIEASSTGVMEVYNAHPRANQAGHAGFRLPTEAAWDVVLSSGRQVWGVAADDAHDFGLRGALLRPFGGAPPGGAWIVVRATKLDRQSILNAIAAGDFYGSTGVVLSNISTGQGLYRVDVDLEATRREIGHSWVRKAAPVVESDDSHLVIEFIGRDGRLLYWTHDLEAAALELPDDEPYVRARITYLDKLPSMTGADRARAFYAWTQPLFASGSSAEDFNAPVDAAD